MKNSRKKIFGHTFKSVLLIALMFVFSSCIFDPPEISLLDRLHKYQYVSVDFGADIESNNEIVSFSSLSVDNVNPGTNQNWPLEWNGKSFSVSYDYDYTLFSGERVHSYGTISGTLSDDGKTMETFTGNQTSLYPDQGDVFKYFISVIDVPYNAEYTYDAYSPRFSAEGPGVSNHIYSYSQSWDFVDSNGDPKSLYATTVNYNNPDDEPYLYITFSGD